MAGYADGEHDRARRFCDAALPYLDDVFTLARYLMRNATDAGDALQECYVRALHHFDRYRGPSIIAPGSTPFQMLLCGHLPTRS
jgi:DNA-directed RNA polymerase specialized sigma24 family protein